MFSAIGICCLFFRVLGQNSSPIPRLTVSLTSSSSFCLIVSPFGSLIAHSEKSAQAACHGPTTDGALAMPRGLIKSAHVVVTDRYTQVTGRIDAAAGGYAESDTGTQFDDSLASQGGVLPDSGCRDFPMYLEYFTADTYCLRCCVHAFSSYCDPTKDTQGCENGIPGDFGPGFTDSKKDAPPAMPVVDYHGCAPAVDTCASSSSGFECCVSLGDATAGLDTKTTCQYQTDCATDLSTTSNATMTLSTTIPNRTRNENTATEETTSVLAETTDLSPTNPNPNQSNNNKAAHHLPFFNLLLLLILCL